MIIMSGLRDNVYVDLKGGDKITLRNGDVLTFDEYYGKITNTEDSRVNYTDELKHTSRSELDIVKVERPTQYETIYENTASATNNIDDVKKALKELLGL